ncbi:MerR family transcriptional regulator [Streptococcus agalactiae]|uniref:MerR family transcriptional regulator n=1 Tax=Streptococcus agalactiae TaxID=1311 RepID=UPI002B03CEC0|nr:MerR family transcriptional regulator [Streptococcus agalactiae]
MSEKYSTGDLAKEAGVTVRTVQYYDKRGILSPSELSEGGRRVYSIADLEKLRQIIYLRDLDFSIDNIKNLFTEDNASQILELFLQVQIRELRLSIDSKKDKLDKAVNLLKTVEKQDSKTLGYLSDIVLMEENKRKWGKLQKSIVLQVIMIIMVYITLIMAAVSLNQRWLMWIAVTVFLIAMNGMVWYFKQQVVYLCPNCHQTFTPTYQAFNLVKHTPKTRKVFCPHCHQKSHCIELAREER